MLDQRRRRWPNVEPTLSQRPVSDGIIWRRHVFYVKITTEFRIRKLYLDLL